MKRHYRTSARGSTSLRSLRTLLQKKFGMWLFLLLTAWTFGRAALLLQLRAFRSQTGRAIPSEARNATIMTAFSAHGSLDLVLAVRAAQVNGDDKSATPMDLARWDLRYRDLLYFGREGSHLICNGSDSARLSGWPGHATTGELRT